MYNGSTILIAYFALGFMFNLIPMSYNYLPLDSKWLHFQQIKNLLDYEQLVSITFDAHKKILQCREHVDQQPEQKSTLLLYDVPEYIDEVLSHHDAVSLELMKLVLMLKIKSLCYGVSGISIDTVKRLLEMYNNGIFPLLITTKSSALQKQKNFLAHILNSVKGLGNVYFKNEVRPAMEVFRKMNWQPLKLMSYEEEALATGSQLTLAAGIILLKKAERLLSLAELVTALSVWSIDGSIEPFQPTLPAFSNNNAKAKAGAAVMKFVGGSEAFSNLRKGSFESSSFDCFTTVNGSAKEAVEYVMQVFMREINSPSEDVAVFSTDKVIVNINRCATAPLNLAMLFLNLAFVQVFQSGRHRIVEIAQLSSEKLNHGDERKSGRLNIFITIAEKIAEGKYFSGDVELTGTGDAMNFAGKDSSECWQTLSSVEKLLAIEWIMAAEIWAEKNFASPAPVIAKYLNEYREKVDFNVGEMLVQSAIDNTIKWMKALNMDT